MTTRDKLSALAANLWWAWQDDVLEIFEELNPEAFRQNGNNPTVALREAQPRALASKALQRRVDEAYERFEGYLATPGTHADTARTAYFCMEYGLHESLNLYSGGLGILAGDHVKAACDLGLDFAAIGLLLRDGYFQQRFNADGWQQEAYTELDPADHPLELVRTRTGDVLRVTVHLGDTAAAAAGVARTVGKSRLYLLDTDLDENPAEHRSSRASSTGATARPASSRRSCSASAGCARCGRIGIEPGRHHMNEGHAPSWCSNAARAARRRTHARAEAEAGCATTACSPPTRPWWPGTTASSPSCLSTQLSLPARGPGACRDGAARLGRVEPDRCQRVVHHDGARRSSARAPPTA